MTTAHVDEHYVKCSKSESKLSQMTSPVNHTTSGIGQINMHVVVTTNSSVVRTCIIIFQVDFADHAWLITEFWFLLQVRC